MSVGTTETTIISKRNPQERTAVHRSVEVFLALTVDPHELDRHKRALTGLRQNSTVTAEQEEAAEDMVTNDRRHPGLDAPAGTHQRGRRLPPDASPL
jgi:hypothetical protein